MKKYDVGLSVIFSLFGLTVIYLSKDLGTASQGFGAGTWPRFLGMLLIFLSAILFLQAMTKKKPETDSAEEEDPIQFASVGMKRVYLIVLILVLYSLMQKWVGFYISCGIMLPLVMLVMGERRPLVLFAVAGGVILAVFLIFGLILHTPLPRGTFF